MDKSKTAHTNKHYQTIHIKDKNKGGGVSKCARSEEGCRESWAGKERRWHGELWKRKRKLSSTDAWKAKKKNPLWRITFIQRAGGKGSEEAGTKAFLAGTAMKSWYGEAWLPRWLDSMSRTVEQDELNRHWEAVPQKQEQVSEWSLSSIWSWLPASGFHCLRFHTISEPSFGWMLHCYLFQCI